MTRNATRFVTLLVATVLMGVAPALAGNGGYTSLSYDVTSGSYSPISGGTLHASGSAIGSFATTANIPFSVTWGDNTYSQITVAGSGQMWFGTTASNAVWAWNMGITGASNGELRTAELGTSPNRVFVIQWSNMTRSPQGSSNDRYNFQVRIHENGDAAEVVYGSMNVTALCAPQIGARTSNMELGLFASYWYNTWEHPYLNMGPSIALAGWAPASGLTYTFANQGGYDAGITGLSSPSEKFNAGQSQTIRATITNHGANPIDSVMVRWSVNGTARTPAQYNADPALQPGESVTVQLGSVSFSDKSFNTIVVETDMPNGSVDTRQGNDAYMAYLAPRVEGRLNVAQGSGNAGVFPNINTAVRHLFVSGTSSDVNVHIFSGSYNEQLIIPAIDGGDMVTFMAADGAEPIITWQPSNNPSWNIGPDRATYQAYVWEDANVKFDGIEFRMPNGLNWGGHIYGDGHSVLMVDNCTFTGVNNFLTQTSPVYAINANGSNTWVMNSMFEKVYYGISIDGGSTDDRVTGNTMTDVGNTGVMMNSGRFDVSGNTISSSNGTAFFVGVYVDGAGIVANNVISADIAAQSGSGATGLAIRSRDNFASTTDGVDAYNNMIAIGAENEAAGIIVVPGSMQDATRIYHNSVNITGLAGTNGGSAAFYIGYDFPTNGDRVEQPKGDQSQGFQAMGEYQVVNNIFHNAGTGTNGGFAVAYDLDYQSTSDFNNLMTTGMYVGVFGGLPVMRNTTGNPLTDWRNASGGDYNSSSVAVNFVGGSDLHLQEIDRSLFGSSSISNLVPEDIDGETRRIPYMGADEVAPTIRIIEQPQSRYACLGEGFTLLCIADVTTGADVVYQWYKDGVKLVGQTGAILPFGSVGYGASGVYTCEIVATDGFNEVTLMSEPASLIVVRQTQIAVQPISQPVAPNGIVVLEIVAEAVGSPIDFNPSYQWKKWYWDVNSNSYQTTDVVDNGRITGAQSSQLTIRDITDEDTTDAYICVVTGYCGEATSKAARLFFPTVAASNNTPNVCEGGTIQIECAVVPSSIQGSTVTYRWYFNDAALSNGGDISGADTKVLTIDNAAQANAGTYHCLATYSGVGTSIPTNDIDVTVGVAPTIAAQPVGDTVCEGEAVTMSVDADGENLTYQWMKGTTEIPGATAMTYEVAAATEADAGSYSVMVTNACGDLTSETVDLVVNTAAEITTEPTDVAVFDGDTIRFTVEANGTEPVSYQWYFNDAEIDGATDATYEVEAGPFGEEAGEYYCIVTNACGSDTTLVVNADVTVGVTGGEILPGGYTLGNPMPNPTSNVVAFTYAVPSAQNVTITLTNMVGQQVATVINGMVNSGEHRVEISTQDLNLAPGAYTITFMSKGTTAARQFIVVK